MPELQVSPLLLALATSFLGNSLLIWHRHGGARWMFAAGGFLFVLCARVIIEFLYRADSERQLIGTVFAILISSFGVWSIAALVRVIRRDAFGAAHEEAARVR